MIALGRVFLTWAHGDQEWQDWVAGFACLLDRYVDVEIDLFRSTESEVDWTRYGPLAVRSADTVVIVGSDDYWASWAGDPRAGAGSAREADALHGLYDVDRKLFQHKVIIALLPGASDRAIPYDLRRVHRYRVDELTPAGVSVLLRRLFGVPEHRKRAEKLAPPFPVRGQRGSAAAWSVRKPDTAAQKDAQSSSVIARLSAIMPRRAT